MFDKTALLAKITVPLLAKAIGVLLLVIVAMFIRIQFVKGELALAQSQKVNAEEAAKQNAAIANNNHEANKYLATQLNACSTERIRVDRSAADAVSKSKEKIAKAEAEARNWQARLAQSRNIPSCEEWLRRAMPASCNISDF